MNVITFYRWGLAVPIIAPLCASILLKVFGASDNDAKAIIFPTLVGSIPYLVTLALLTRTLRRGEEQEMRRLLWRLPLYMASLELGGAVLYGLATVIYLNVGAKTGAPTNIASTLQIGALATGVSAMMFIPVTLMIGYTYIFIVHGVLSILQRANGIKTPNESKVTVDNK